MGIIDFQNGEESVIKRAYDPIVELITAFLLQWSRFMQNRSPTSDGTLIDTLL